MIRSLLITLSLAGCETDVLEHPLLQEEAEYLIILPLCIAGCSANVTGIGGTTAATSGALTTAGHSVTTSQSSTRN